MNSLIKTIQNVGFSSKAAQVYLAALELGEATVQELASQAGLNRTTVYYTIDELIELGALTEIRRLKKIHYQAVPPEAVAKRAREAVGELEDALPTLQSRQHAAYARPKVTLLFGPNGFKQVWDRIFASGEKEFCIITEGVGFLDYVKEKYILRDIIKQKQQLEIHTRQLIVDSLYARRVTAKDKTENRTSKLLSKETQLPFTTIILKSFVVFVSPRNENLLLLVESQGLAQSQQAMFDALWNGN